MQRREFLKSLGIVTPAYLIPAPGSDMEARFKRLHVYPQEIYEIYVSECLSLWSHWHGVRPDDLTILRQIFEVQAAALARVLTHLQARMNGIADEADSGDHQ